MSNNSLVLNLKGQGVYGSDNVWALLDILQPYYAEDAIQSLVEWKMKDGAGVYDASNINSCAFTANSGYAGVLATQKFIKTNFAANNGTNYTLNANCFGGMYSNVGVAGYLSGQLVYAYSWLRSTAVNGVAIDARNNANAAATGLFNDTTDTAGLFLNNRISSTQFQLIKDSTVKSTINQNSFDLGTNSFGANGTMDTPTTINNLALGATVKVWIAGGNLTSYRSQLYNSLLAYIS